jgi:sporulation protein YlmC with PRC-barrel domain
MTTGTDRERRIERLLGRRVFDGDGRAVGRIEEMRAEKEHDYFVVTEIDVGPVALLERLSVRHLGITWPGRSHGYRVRWDQIDLEDEQRPRLLCDRSELRLITPARTRRRG